MKFRSYAVPVLSLVLWLKAPEAQAQAQPTARQDLQLSVFGLGNETIAGLGGASNIGATAGIDLGVRLFDRLLPSLEVRGTYPFYRGKTASADNALGGLKVEGVFGRYHPYVDVLAGRSQFEYANGGYPNPQNTFRYTKSPSNTYCGGAGVDLYLTGQWSAKADFQLERNSVPVTSSGHLWSERIAAGVQYRFNFNRHRYFSR